VNTEAHDKIGALLTQPQSRSPGAERMARHRRRRKGGFRCLTIELRESEIDALIRSGRLAPDSRGDLPAVRKALYGFLDDTLR
jgi:hypothetical protein